MMAQIKFDVIFLAVVLCVSGNASAYSGGDGTSSDPYQIANLTNFKQLSATPADWGKSFILTANINLSGQTYTQAPIAPDTSTSDGFHGTQFTGRFDGDGHTISNLTIAKPTKDYIGLFGKVGRYGHISNLGVRNVDLTGRDNVGGLAGFSYESTIISCNSTGSVNGDEVVGGLLGWNSGSGVSDSYSTCAVDGTKWVGGFMGFSDDDGSAESCYASGEVSGSTIMGGFVGSNGNGSPMSASSISLCYAVGDVVGSGNFIGGFAGNNSTEGSITSCYAKGAVVGYDEVGGFAGYNYGDIVRSYSVGKPKGHSFVGGFCGFGTTGSVLTGNFWDTQTSGKSSGVGYGSSTGAAGKTTVKMKTQSTFTAAGWDFVGETTNGTDDIWTIGESVSYPEFAWQITAAPSSPTSVSASDAHYSDKVRVTWSSSLGATSYEVWRNTSNDSGTAVKLGDGISYYDDNSVTVDTTYYYWVKAKNSYGTSGFSPSDTGSASANPHYSLSITKCTVAASSKINKDKISFSGTMNATAEDFNDASTVNVAIDSNEMVNPYARTFPINTSTFKNGKYSYSKTESGAKRSFTYNAATGKFAFAASNIDLSGLDCPVNVVIQIGDPNAVADIDETIANGAKKPMPILLMMDVNNVLAVSKCTVKQNNKKANSDQLTVKGLFAVEDVNVDMTTSVFVVTLDAQTFTLPASSFIENKNGFICSKAAVAGGGTANVTFNFNSSSFIITIKGVNIHPISGDVDFGIAFTGFNKTVQVTLP